MINYFIKDPFKHFGKRKIHIVMHHRLRFQEVKIWIINKLFGGTIEIIVREAILSPNAVMDIAGATGFTGEYGENHSEHRIFKEENQPLVEEGKVIPKKRKTTKKRRSVHKK